jgi:dTDP-4-amino-4,6-dideoxygalactose transaminase
MLGEVDKYSWQDTGSSFGLSDLNAAYLLGQLEARDRIIRKRKAIFDAYLERLAGPAADHGLTLPSLGTGSAPGYHLFHVLLPDGENRDRVLAGMRERGVLATFHYVPLHSSPGGLRFAARTTECPVTDSVSRRLIRLPFHNRMSIGDVDRVVETFLALL